MCCIFQIVSGFPPKPLDISDKDRSIESLGVRSGDTIIFQNLQPPAPTPPASSSLAFGSSAFSTASSNTSSPAKSENSPAPDPKRQKIEVEGPKMERQVNCFCMIPDLLVLQVVPADNSCLFTAINYCMSGEVVASENSQFMREVGVYLYLYLYLCLILYLSGDSLCSWLRPREIQ